jgi:acyl CoA:acetate/3-ketoacid CoA transferase alpha subunit
MTVTSLNLKKLSTDFRPGLSEKQGGCMAEAAAVCLDNQKHKSGVLLYVTGNIENTYSLIFDKVTDHMRRSHADLAEATELGACGIAILLIESNTDFTTVE